CGLQERMQRILGGSGAANVVVHQEKFFKLRMIERLRWTDRLLCKSFGFGSGIGVKRCAFYVAASWPKSGAVDFVRIGFARDGVDSGPLRSTAAREARGCQVKASPEKMDRTGFANEKRAKLLEDGLAAYENPPKAVGVFGIVGGMLRVLIEGNRVGNFDGHLPDFDGNPQR